MEFNTKGSNAKVVLNAASFRDAFSLKATIIKALKESGIKVSLDSFETMDGLMSIWMALDSSEELFNMIMKCLQKSTYNGVRITEETFEDEKARGDMYEIFIECIKINILPFYTPLLSRLKIELPTIGDDQK